MLVGLVRSSPKSTFNAALALTVRLPEAPTCTRVVAASSNASTAGLAPPNASTNLCKLSWNGSELAYCVENARLNLIAVVVMPPVPSLPAPVLSPARAAVHGMVEALALCAAVMASTIFLPVVWPGLRRMVSTLPLPSQLTWALSSVIEESPTNRMIDPSRLFPEAVLVMEKSLLSPPGITVAVEPE